MERIRAKKQERLEKEYFEALTLDIGLRVKTPEALKKVLSDVPPELIAKAFNVEYVEKLTQNAEAQGVGESVQALDDEQLSKVEDALTAEQLEMMLERKRAREQGNQ